MGTQSAKAQLLVLVSKSARKGAYQRLAENRWSKGQWFWEALWTQRDLEEWHLTSIKSASCNILPEQLVSARGFQLGRRWSAWMGSFQAARRPCLGDFLAWWWGHRICTSGFVLWDDQRSWCPGWTAPSHRVCGDLRDRPSPSRWVAWDLSTFRWDISSVAAFSESTRSKIGLKAGVWTLERAKSWPEWLSCRIQTGRPWWYSYPPKTSDPWSLIAGLMSQEASDPSSQGW